MGHAAGNEAGGISRIIFLLKEEFGDHGEINLSVGFEKS